MAESFLSGILIGLSPKPLTPTSSKKKVCTKSRTCKKRSRNNNSAQAPRIPSKRLRLSTQPKMPLPRSPAPQSGAAASEDPFDRMQKFMETQFKATNLNISTINNAVVKLKDQVDDNSNKLQVLSTSTRQAAEASALEIASLHKKIEAKDVARKEEIERLRKTVSELPPARSLAQPATSPDLSSTRPLYSDVARDRKALAPPSLSSFEEKYWTARRSLRLWPVEGQNKHDLVRNCLEFLGDKLSIPCDAVSDYDLEAIRRVHSGRQSQIKAEISVLFSSVAIRDMVASFSRNLGNYVDSSNKPTAGLRLEIPDALGGVHRDLKRYGGELRKIHGEGLKRNIKFDDTALTFFMDVRLPLAENDDWMRVDWHMAKDYINQNLRQTAATTRRRLASSVSSDQADDVAMEENDRATDPARPTIPISSTLEKYSRPRPGWGDNR